MHGGKLLTEQRPPCPQCDRMVSGERHWIVGWQVWVDGLTTPDAGKLLSGDAALQCGPLTPVGAVSFAVATHYHLPVQSLWVRAQVVRCKG